MSNYQMCRAVKLNINSGTQRWILPEGDLFWDHLVDFMRCKYDPGNTAHALVANRQLPPFLCPVETDTVSLETGPWNLGGHQINGRTALAGDYWICSFARGEFFWRQLWEAGNRGRVVFEFQAEVGYDGTGLPGDGGGFYVVTVDLDEDGPRTVVHDDDPAFYEAVHALHDAAEQAALKEAGVQSAEELEGGYFSWYANEEVKPYYVYQRHDLLDFAQKGFSVLNEGFSTE